MNLREQLIGFEGWRNEAYPDPLTHGEPFTIGVGHCGPEVCKGLVWTNEMIDATLDADIAAKRAQCEAALAPWFAGLNEPRQAALIGMAFQMGINGLLKFHDTLAAIRDERYEHAGECMRASNWARQTPKRALRLSFQIASGEWQ